MAPTVLTCKISVIYSAPCSPITVVAMVYFTFLPVMMTMMETNDRLCECRQSVCVLYIDSGFLFIFHPCVPTHCTPRRYGDCAL